jgi:hypothetical protein
MRGFPDLPSREPMKARFYEGELWKGGWVLVDDSDG